MLVEQSHKAGQLDGTTPGSSRAVFEFSEKTRAR